MSDWNLTVSGVNVDQKRIGILSATLAYVLWGFLPLYWQLLEGIPAWEVLAHRILWSAVLLGVLIGFLNGYRHFFLEFLSLARDRRKAIGVFAAGVAVSVNWGVYIWAVTNAHIVEASLGYYINPLLSILLGMIFLQERFSRLQWLAIAFAFSGVAYMTLNFGSIPWIALSLAFSFGAYGLFKKVSHLGPVVGLTLETLLVLPIAGIYLFWLHQSGAGSFSAGRPGLLLIGGGLATIIPLLLFALATKRIPLSMIGFLQYCAPTIKLLIGVFWFKEAFTPTHAITFALIWIGLILYTATQIREAKRPTPLPNPT